MALVASSMFIRALIRQDQKRQLKKVPEEQAFAEVAAVVAALATSLSNRQHDADRTVLERWRISSVENSNRQSGEVAF